MHYPTLLLCAIVVATLPALRGEMPKRSVRPEDMPPPPSPEEVARVEKSADILAEAVLTSPDMCFKRPVLEAAFVDSPEWERRLQTIIEREEWEFARISFIHFYWRKVTKKDAVFLRRQFLWVQDAVHRDPNLEGWNEVDEILAEALK